MDVNFAERLIHLRRRLHRIPEIGYNLPKTKAVLQDVFREAGIELKPLAGGLVADIGQGSRRVLLRADMDALPQIDQKAVPYHSQHEGACHACGHDGHMAMLYGAALLLLENASGCPVRLMLQPAEECPPGGALQMVEAGVLEGVEQAFALHVSADLPFGSVGVKSGPLMAATDTFELTVHGKGGHGAFPHTAADAIVASAHVVSALQTVASRLIDPLEPVVVTIGKISGGTADNVIADKVVLLGTVRTLSESLRNTMPDKIAAVAAHAAEASGCTTHLQFRFGYPVLQNDEECALSAAKTAAGLVGQDKVVLLSRPLMGGEDFAYVLQRVPGAMLFLGIKDDVHTYPIHHPCFDFNDEILAVGAHLLHQLAQSLTLT